MRAKNREPRLRSGSNCRIADAPKNDPVGLQLEEENLPQRIRVARSYYERYVTLENTGHAPAGGACIRGRAAGTTGCNTQPF